jgi:hypothetical protein
MRRLTVAKALRAAAGSAAHSRAPRSEMAAAANFGIVVGPQIAVRRQLILLQMRPPRTQPWVVSVSGPTLMVMRYVISRCGSQASPVMTDGPDGDTFITSLSPTFSIPGLIQVLIAQYAPPQGSTRTRAFPSPRAQRPSSEGSAAVAGHAAKQKTTPNALKALHNLG